MKLSLEQRTQLNRIAEEVREIMGDVVRADGRAKTFEELEEECVAAGDWLTCQVLQKRVATRDGSESVPCCPKCHRAGERIPDDEVRLLQTSRGEAAWTEAGWFCPPCRRAFFPSVG